MTSGGQRILRKIIRDPKGLSVRSLSLLSRVWPHPILKIWIRIFREVSPLCREKGLQNILFNYAGIPRISLPPVIFIALTSRCNLRCPDCSVHRDQPDDLSPDLLDRVITEAKKKGVKIFFLAGGEPFLWLDLLNLLKKHQDVYFEIITNGTLIDESWAESLARMGHAAVFFSLEGLEGATDKRRGKGVFAKITQAMSLLQEKGLCLGLSVLVTPENFDEVTSDAFIRRMIRQGILMVYYFSYKPVGDRPDLSFILSPDERRLLYQRIMNIRNSYPIIALDHENDMSPLGGCIATRGLGIYINAKGQIQPCGILHYADTAVGPGRSLQEAFENSPFLKGVRSLYRPSAGCLWTDRPQELLDLIQKIFPEKYSNFSDLNFLREYANRCKRAPSPRKSGVKKDLYTRIGGLFFKGVCKKLDGTS